MPKSSTRRRSKRGSAALIFQRRNYVLMIIGVLCVVVGYALMRIENEFQGFISLYVAPLIILAGYAEIIYAILWRPAGDENEEKDEAVASS